MNTTDEIFDQVAKHVAEHYSAYAFGRHRVRLVLNGMSIDATVTRPRCPGASFTVEIRGESRLSPCPVAGSVDWIPEVVTYTDGIVEAVRKKNRVKT